MREDAPVEDGDAALSGERARGEHRRRRTRRDAFSGLDQHHLIGEAQHLVERVADVDDGQEGEVAQPFEIGQDLALAVLIHRRDRFVEEEQARLGQQGPADGDTLALATRERRGAPRHEMADAEHIDDARGVLGDLASTSPRETIGEVLCHAQMREEPRVLEDEAAAALFDRHVELAGGIEEHLPAEGDHAVARLDDARDRAHQRRLPGT